MATTKNPKDAATQEARWRKLTWDDLNAWAGGRSVERGRTYQRTHRVRDLARSAETATGVPAAVCRAYLDDLDWALDYRHLAGLTDFFRRLARDGLVPDGTLSFITAA